MAELLDIGSRNITLSKKDKEYIDLSLAFVPSPLDDDITTLKNERAINNSIKNIVMTQVLEVPFNRDFGSYITSYLFDVVDTNTSGQLYLEIKRAITFCEPRVQIQNIDLSVRLEQQAIDCRIQYKIIGSEKIYEVQELLTPTK